jgi:hypothetical protein
LVLEKAEGSVAVRPADERKQRTYGFDREDSMKVRAKFCVTKVSELGDWNGNRQEIMAEGPKDSAGISHYQTTGVPVREITLSAIGADKSDPESVSFAQATPSGTITFMLNNPVLAEEFKPGAVYYLDFIPVGS